MKMKTERKKLMKALEVTSFLKAMATGTTGCLASSMTTLA